MGAQGTVVLDFGAFPGVSDASVVVTGQAAILGTSLVEAWMYPADTADHLADEHLVESIDIYAGKIVTGTGFTVYGVNENNLTEQPLGAPNTGKGTRIYGKWTVAWAWN